MDEAFLSLLRCPIDPTRQATLSREQQTLICSGCGCRFPVKQGIPVLIPDEAELPPGVSRPQELPCLRTPGNRTGK